MGTKSSSTSYWYSCSKSECSASYRFCLTTNQLHAVSENHSTHEREIVDPEADYNLRRDLENHARENGKTAKSRIVVDGMIAQQSCSAEIKANMTLKRGDYVQFFNKRLGKVKKASALLPVSFFQVFFFKKRRGSG